MTARVLVIGLDGASLNLVRPWAEDGDLPHLAPLMDSGAWGELLSTVPPATFPAWTSLMTGVNPGCHGVFDFTRRVPGTYRVEFINATYRQRPSVWHLLSKAGCRIGVMGLPATYPPEPVNGFMISGFDSPVTTGIDGSFTHPASLYDEIRRAIGPYEITDFQELRIGPGWHEMALGKMLDALQRRTDIAAYLLDREPWDCFFVHFGESDTVAHHFWALHDADSPRHNQAQAAHLGQAIHTIYRALDRAVGELLAHAGDGATILVVSDHGSGGTGTHVIHLNRWLAHQGRLKFQAESTSGVLARALKQLGLALPSSLQERTFRGPLRPLADRLESGARLGGIDWSETCAFSEEVNTFPSIWLNVRGREPAGVVEPGLDYERLQSEIIARLVLWRNPATGQPVVERAWRREELYHGPAVQDAPDIIIEPALDQGYAYTYLTSAGQAGDPIRTLSPAEHLGAKGGSMNGSHRPAGMLVLAGPEVRPSLCLTGARIVDIAPTLLHLLGEQVPAGLDGRVLSEALTDTDEIRKGPAAPGAAQPPDAYSDEQSSVIGSRLEGLGYQT